MAVDVARIVPTGLAVTVIGYCVWPYLLGSAETPDLPPAVKPPEISVAMLAPAVPPLPERDPFHAVDAAASAKGKAAALLAGANAKGGSPALRGASAAGGAGTKPPQKVTDPLQGLALEATCLADQGRLAMINGHIYRQRETVQSPIAGAPPCVVAQVFPDRVLLNTQGKTLELKYSNASGSAGPREESAAGSKRNASAAGPRSKNSAAKFSAPKSH